MASPKFRHLDIDAFEKMFDEPFNFVVHFCRFHNGSQIKSSEKIIMSDPPPLASLPIENVEEGDAGEYTYSVLSQPKKDEYKVKFIVKVMVSMIMHQC